MYSHRNYYVCIHTGTIMYVCMYVFTPELLCMYVCIHPATIMYVCMYSHRNYYVCMYVCIHTGTIMKVCIHTGLITIYVAILHIFHDNVPFLVFGVCVFPRLRWDYD